MYTGQNRSGEGVYAEKRSRFASTLARRHKAAKKVPQRSTRGMHVRSYLEGSGLRLTGEKESVHALLGSGGISTT